MAHPVQVTDESFKKDVIEAEGLVLVDFWAPWCGPCKMVAPVLEQIAEELDGKLTIAKVNVDDNPQLQEQFEIMSIPTLMLIKTVKNENNEDVRVIAEKIVGFQPKPRLMDKIQGHLN